MQPEAALYGRSWMYIRFGDSLAFADFNRVLWGLFWKVETNARMLADRLYDIAWATPSNFTRYCWQYLGDDYFTREDDDEFIPIEDVDDGPGDYDAESTVVGD